MKLVKTFYVCIPYGYAFCAGFSQELQVRIYNSSYNKTSLKFCENFRIFFKSING